MNRRRTLATVLLMCCALLIAGCNTEQATAKPAAEKKREKQRLPYVKSLHMIDGNKGWMLAIQDSSRRLLKTGDGGRSWRDVTPEAETVIPAYILDEKHVWLTTKEFADKQLVYTADGGETWAKSEPLSTESQMMGLHFLNEKTGWMTNYVRGIGAGGSQIELAKTEDGGKTWVAISGGSTEKEIPVEGYKSKAVLSSNDEGWIPLAASGHPWAYRSINGGADWEFYSLPVTEQMPKEQFFDMQPPIFFSDTAGLIPLYFLTDRLEVYVYSTEDGGRNWDIPPALDIPLQNSGEYEIEMDAVSLNRMWLVSNRNEMYAFDNGWKTVASVKSLIENNARILAFDFINESEGWMAIGNEEGALLYKTEDGGMSWNEVMVKNIDL
ncbi:WD40/YVTN/BNR-like repeat-containing protein [Neobacillus sp. SCS-31]|uniref:WD40/YVTN/BNR-like repeat-containing protein n=1 Tax=Neobacillus oceani TaxID=3115292 RepID=UPI003905F060